MPCLLSSWRSYPGPAQGANSTPNDEEPILATAFGVMPNSLAPQRLPTMASLWPRDNEDTGGDKWQRMTGRLYKLWHQAPDLCKKGHPKSICCHRQSPNQLRISSDRPGSQ